MAKEPFNGVNISSLVQQMGCKTVTKCMDAPAFGYAGFFLARQKTLCAADLLR